MKDHFKAIIYLLGVIASTFLLVCLFIFAIRYFEKASSIILALVLPSLLFYGLLDVYRDILSSVRGKR